MYSFSSALSVVLVPLLIASPVWSQTAQIPGGAAAPAAPGQLQMRLVDSDGAQVPSNTRTTRGIGVQVLDGNGAPVSDAAVVFRFPDNGSSASFADGSHSAVAYTDATGAAHVGNFQWNALPGAVAVRVTASKGTTHAGLLVEQTLTGGVPSQASVPVKPISVPATEAGAAIASTDEPDEVVAPNAGAKIAAAPAAVVENAGYFANPYRGARLGVSPMVSISNTGGNGHDFAYHGSSKKKWIILGIAAGAGAGLAFALLSGKAGTTAAGPSGVSVGTPTISIGHP